jgi:hypothetical protein
LQVEVGYDVVLTVRHKQMCPESAFLPKPKGEAQRKVFPPFCPSWFSLLRTGMEARRISRHLVITCQ